MKSVLMIQNVYNILNLLKKHPQGSTFEFEKLWGFTIGKICKYMSN